MTTTTLTPTYAPVDPYMVRQAMIDDGVLFILLPDGSYRPVTAVERVKETRHLSDGTLFPYTVGWNVSYEGQSQMIYSQSADDTVLYVDHTPKVGMGATLHYPNDRHPYTVIEVISADEVIVQRDVVHHTSGNFREGNVVWEAQRNPKGKTERIKYSEERGWRTSARDGSQYFTVGSRSYYEAPEV